MTKLKLFIILKLLIIFFATCKKPKHIEPFLEPGEYTMIGNGMIYDAEYDVITKQYKLLGARVPTKYGDREKGIYLIEKINDDYFLSLKTANKNEEYIARMRIANENIDFGNNFYILAYPHHTIYMRGKRINNKKIAGVYLEFLPSPRPGIYTANADSCNFTLTKNQ